MPAPAPLIIHGQADALNDLLDEENLDLKDYKFKVSRQTRDRVNRHGNLRRREYFNPIVAISFTAFIVNAAGLADQHPGTRVIALANYAVDARGFDPAVGTMMLDDAEDSKTQESDLETSMNITHAPFVVSA